MNLTNCTKALCLFFSLMFCTSATSAQNTINDDFSNAEKSKNLWFGNWNYFQVKNEKLTSNCDLINHTFGLKTRFFFDQQTEIQWNSIIDLGFETSSQNYVDLVLVEDSSNNNSIFIRLGNAKDEVAIYSIKNNGSPISLSDGPDKSTGNNSIEILAIYQNDSMQVGYREVGNIPFIFLTTVPFHYPSNPYFTGFNIRQSTASFFNKHSLQHFALRPYLADRIPPVLLTTTVKDGHHLQLTFDEGINPEMVKFFIWDEQTEPIKISWISENEVDLEFNITFLESFDLKVENACDAFGNCLPLITKTLSYQKPIPAAKYDIIISEIHPDPEPQVGLPPYEFVELYNRSEKSVNLDNWLFSDPTKSVPLKSYVLQPNQFVILCDQKYVDDFAPFGDVIGLSSWPSLNNSGDTLWISSPENNIIHKVIYESTDFGTSWKKEGGWTLEMMDIEQPCLQNNWKVSESKIGGTPGNMNSVNQQIIDKNPPKLIQSIAISPTEIQLIFDKWLIEDALEFVSINSAQIEINHLNMSGLNTINFRLTEDLKPRQAYQISISNVFDCLNNVLVDTIIQIGLTELPEEGDVLINEILFNPESGVEDFVEIYNVSDKYINLTELRLAQKDSSGVWNELITISQQPFVLPPNTIIAMSENINALKTNYPNSNRMKLVASNLPSLPDNYGNIGLCLSNGTQIDWMQYDKSQHSPLMPKTEGVSLERISIHQMSTDISNWTSASYTSGYATPGYQNSVAVVPIEQEGKITIKPDPFSPNGDGLNDVLQIGIQLEESSVLYQIKIFDLQGNLISFPINSAYGTGNETFMWNGLDVNHQITLPGIYVLLCEYQSESGKSGVLKAPLTIDWR